MNHLAASHFKTKNTSIELDFICEQLNFITNHEQFLIEADSKKALLYWIETHFPDYEIESTQDIINLVQHSISLINELINEQLNEIIHHPTFQQLEASWRGLDYLINQAEDAKNIKIKMLSLSWSELAKDMMRSLEFDQSQLFNKIYSEEYGTPGGEPYGVLLGDYEISHKPSQRHTYDDISVLEHIAEVASASFCPFIAGASSELFGLDDFSSLPNTLKLDSVFAQKEYIKWENLRRKLDSRFIGLTLPRVLMRKPYRTEPGNYKGHFFYENIGNANAQSYLWGNACYALGGILLREFKNIGWFGHIRGAPRNHLGGGLLTNLTKINFSTDKNPIAYRPATEIIITDTTEKSLSELGFIPICQCYDVPFSAFYSNQSIHRPSGYRSKEGKTNAKLSAMLQHILCASRIAHYIKVIIRDKVGSFISAEECEKYLRDWIYQYTTGRDDLDWEEQAKYPLRDAQVNVEEHPSKKGKYHCTIFLRPHYQLDQMISELELVTELTKNH